MSSVRRAVSTLRRPEYTGANRCWPCTAVNLVLAALLAGALAAATWAWLPSAAAGVGLVALAVSLGAIYLRGYLVPGTPALTKRYLPDRVLRWFDKGPASAAAGGAQATATERRHGDGDSAAVDVEALLLDADAVTECEREDDLCLTDEFRGAWRGRIQTLRDSDASRDDLADFLAVDADALSLQEHGDAFVATHEGRRVGQWESRAAFVADVAAASELRERYPGWESLPVGEQSRALNGLRLFLEQCPACDGPVAPGHDVVESCCRSIDVVAVTCEACGARLFEAEQPDPPAA